MRPLKTKTGDFIGIKGTNKIIGIREVPNPKTYTPPKSYIAKHNKRNPYC